MPIDIISTGSDVWVPNLTETDSIVVVNSKEYSYDDLLSTHNYNNCAEELRSEKVSNIGDISDNWEMVY